jgi:serine/threonine protein kinase
MGLFNLFFGLNDMHRHNIVHHDIKQENIVIDKNLNMKFIDFGFLENLSSSVGPQIRSNTVYFVWPPDKILYSKIKPTYDEIKQHINNCYNNEYYYSNVTFINRFGGNFYQPDELYDEIKKYSTNNNIMKTIPKLVDVFSFGLVVLEICSTQNIFQTTQMRRDIRKLGLMMTELNVNKRIDAITALNNYVKIIDPYLDKKSKNYISILNIYANNKRINLKQISDKLQQNKNIPRRTPPPPPPPPPRTDKCNFDRNKPCNSKNRKTNRYTKNDLIKLCDTCGIQVTKKDTIDIMCKKLTTHFETRETDDKPTGKKETTGKNVTCSFDETRPCDSKNRKKNRYTKAELYELCDKCNIPTTKKDTMDTMCKKLKKFNKK